MSAKEDSNVECRDVARITICCCMLIMTYMEQVAMQLRDRKGMYCMNPRFSNFKPYDYPTRGAVRKATELCCGIVGVPGEKE